MKNYSKTNGRPAALWEKDFIGSTPIIPIITPPHRHEFGVGWDVQYKDQFGKVQARLDGLRADEAAFLRGKHGI